MLEAIAEGDFNVGYILLLGSLCGAIVARHASRPIALEVLPKVVSGEKLLAVALTEPRGGSDAASLELKATRAGDHYVLDGEKTSISMADQADWAVVFRAHGLGGEPRPWRSAFLVDMKAQGVLHRFSDLGERAIGRGSIFFDGVRVPATHRLGGEGSGFAQVMQGFDFSRALIGLAVPRARARLARRDLEAYSRASRLRQAALRQPRRHLSARRGRDDGRGGAATLLQDACRQGRRDAAHARGGDVQVVGAELAFEVVQTCLLMHGHAGYSTDLPFEQRLRDVLGLQIGDGTAQVSEARHRPRSPSKRDVTIKRRVARPH